MKMDGRALGFSFLIVFIGTFISSFIAEWIAIKAATGAIFESFPFLILVGERIDWIPVIIFVIIFSVIGGLVAQRLANEERNRTAYAGALLAAIYSIFFLIVVSQFTPILFIFAALSGLR
jgi:hypothetical protein